jgi:Family of unknown function (DUF6313)
MRVAHFAKDFYWIHFPQYGLVPPDTDAVWRQAQSHWEIIVGHMLDVRAIKNLSDEEAITKAVAVTVGALTSDGVRGRCPVCERGRRGR